MPYSFCLKHYWLVYSYFAWCENLARKAEQTLVHCLTYLVYLASDILRHDATTDTCTSTQTVEHAGIPFSLLEFLMASHVKEANSCTYRQYVFQTVTSYCI